MSLRIELKDVNGLQKRAQGRKKVNKLQKRYNRKTLLWLLLFFPVGVTRMLSSACSWKAGVKYAVSGLMLAALAFVLVYPSPYVRQAGGIELYNAEGEEEPFGPELPETIIGGYVQPEIQSVVLPAEPENAEGPLYVYASKEQRNYHLGTCKFAKASGQELTLYEAYYLGYTPGKCCDAPAYTGLT